MPTKIDKVLVTNLAVLKRKYSAIGVTAIKQGIAALVEADKQRGLTTKLVAIDNVAAMKKLGATAVTTPSDPKQNKDAIDGVFQALKPDYLVLIGAPDVIPFQDLANPMPHVTREEDPDPIVFSDLPYASDAPYSQRVHDFLGPTRVIGRVPDLAAATDPAALLAILAIAAKFQTRTRADYEACFGLSAKVWKGSTTLSVRNLFGKTAGVKLSPPDGPNWPDDLLQRKSHFINCHGMKSISQYYGQQGKKNFPVAHQTSSIDGRIAEGTIVAAECCYGAELYPPGAMPIGPRPSIAQTYLAGGAYGFFGSTTVAYGPANGNGQADLICQFFWRQVLEGASLGRAALEAHHDFVKVSGTLDPTELKTLAQFVLLGDPSIHPIAPNNGPKIVIKPVKGAKKSSHKVAPHAELLAGLASERSTRRDRLLATGQLVQQTVARVRAKAMPVLRDVQNHLQSFLDELGISQGTFHSFAVTTPQRSAAKRLRQLAELAIEAIEEVSAVHIAMGRLVSAEEEADDSSPRHRQYAVVIARESAGQLHVQKLVSR